MSNSLRPMHHSPPGSSVHGIFQARVLEWVAISCSRGSSRPRDRTLVSCISCIGRRILYQHHVLAHWYSFQSVLLVLFRSYLWLFLRITDQLPKSSLSCLILSLSLKSLLLNIDTIYDVNGITHVKPLEIKKCYTPLAFIHLLYPDLASVKALKRKEGAHDFRGLFGGKMHFSQMKVKSWSVQNLWRQHQAHLCTRIFYSGEDWLLAGEG